MTPQTIGWIAAAACLSTIVACTDLTSPKTPDYQLTPLFTTSEGCTAYRFMDDPGLGATKVHYFVACKEDKTAEIIDILKEDAKVPTVKAPPRPPKKAVPK
jgi:hypothetical protein